MFRKIERRAADIAARRGRRAVRRQVRGHGTAPGDPECRQPSGRGGPAVVGEGANLEPVDFEVYCPKVSGRNRHVALARHRRRPLDRDPTIAQETRRARRAAPGRKLEAETEQLRAELGRWAPSTSRSYSRPSRSSRRLSTTARPRAGSRYSRSPSSPSGRLTVRGPSAPGGRPLKLAEARVEDDAHGLVALRVIRDIFGEAGGTPHEHDPREAQRRRGAALRRLPQGRRSQRVAGWRGSSNRSRSALTT